MRATKLENHFKFFSLVLWDGESIPEHVNAIGVLLTIEDPICDEDHVSYLFVSLTEYTNQ